MATIHEILSAKQGETFISVGPATVTRQANPKLSKNQRFYSTVVLKSASSEVLLMLWDDAALWKLPTNVPITLKGKFVKDNFRDTPGINCDELLQPENATKFDKPTEPGTAPKPTMKECLDAGIRGADYMARRKYPELMEAAFTFAANARMNGVKEE